MTDSCTESVCRTLNEATYSPNAKPGYSERCIHSEILKAYPHIQCVVHSHTEAVTPYSFSGVPMRACTHMAGFLGPDPGEPSSLALCIPYHRHLRLSVRSVPVWDIQTAYTEGDVQNMLVSNTRLGNSLARSFGKEKSEVADKNVVLM